MKLKNKSIPYQYIELQNKRNLIKKSMNNNYLYQNEFKFNNIPEQDINKSSSQIILRKWKTKKLPVLKTRKPFNENDYQFIINLNKAKKTKELNDKKKKIKLNKNIKLNPKQLLLKNVSKKYFKCYPKGNLDLIINIIKKEKNKNN